MNFPITKEVVQKTIDKVVRSQMWPVPESFQVKTYCPDPGHEVIASDAHQLVSSWLNSAYRGYVDHWIQADGPDWSQYHLGEARMLANLAFQLAAVSGIKLRWSWPHEWEQNITDYLTAQDWANG